MRIYLAGGMRSGWQDMVKQSVEAHIYYDPRDNGSNEPQEYSAWDFGMVDKCDWVFAYYEADNPSGYGMCVEIGYAKGIGKRVILVDEKSAVSELHRNRLRIVEYAADVYFTDLDRGIDFLARLP